MSTEFRGDFQAEVLVPSKQTPVLVDFWAAWCGPCRVLGPVLEKLETEAQGRWRLVKVDTEAHPQLALQFGIRSIPAVKLFSGGKVVDEFVGALPEPQITAWLDAALGPGPAEEPMDAELEEAERLLRSDPGRARELAAAAAGNGRADRREALLTLARLLDIAQRDAAQELTGRAETRSLYLQGAKDYLAGDEESALQRWIEVVSRDRSLDDDGARRATIAVFQLRGEEDPLTQEYRRKFSAALF